MQVDVIEATGLVLVEFRKPRGTYRVGDVGGVPPADVPAGIGEGEFVLAPVPDGVAVASRDLELHPSTSGDVVTPAATATAGGGGTASIRSDVEIPAGWEKLHHLRRFQLARAITGELPHTAAEADATISTYIKAK